jgi:MFS family permease
MSAAQSDPRSQAWSSQRGEWTRPIGSMRSVILVPSAAVWWWRPMDGGVGRGTPPERFLLAIGAGLRYARYNLHLRATQIRALGFFLFASAYWALLPLVAREQVAGGPELYGILLGAIGMGAVAGAFSLPLLKRHLSPDWVVAAGALGTAVALVLFAIAHQAATALATSVLAGVSWIAVFATLSVSAQVALPSWVRGRGLSIYNTVVFGSLTLGSAIWGKVAALAGLPTAHVVAALGALIAVPLLRRWKLQTAATLDLTPSMHWPEPVVLLDDVESDRGPVLVTVEYQIKPEDSAAMSSRWNSSVRRQSCARVAIVRITGSLPMSPVPLSVSMLQIAISSVAGTPNCRSMRESSAA